MKRQIRRGVFETNSSSTHSLTMCTQEEYSKWERGELYKYGSRFITREEAIAELKSKEYYRDIDWYNDDKVNELIEVHYVTESEFWDGCEDYETFSKSYKTDSGEEVVAFGYYGSDY